MSVIIKGMKFPKGCGSCDLVQDYDEDSVCCPFLRSESWYGTAPDYRLEHCPLIGIPTPHGRLIDADRLLESFGEAIDEDGHFVNFFALVDDSPTIIEAEVNNEQRTKYAICRPYDGITLNTEVEFLLDHNGNVMLFDSESAAWEYFKPIGITEEEPNAIKVVEYKEGDLITDRECNDILERNDDCPLEEVSE